eukprot:CAMPEP_0203868166 /NCGR_PEP_ID=MMETSP0359-20131031/16951_1 /ASSEMBLY_ACC=CAM_ASM_000338 /TAXON_ID=268821 /ORGANISM="Scrippsiella Hangoei, Strain SHTV-5" /LENGTH=157 /DNA_ID=CAMNT_0050786537 /DNA_START=60 /DNA_END=534 /DNA_ORIENTATION=-
MVFATIGAATSNNASHASCGGGVLQDLRCGLQMVHTILVALLIGGADAVARDLARDVAAVPWNRPRSALLLLEVRGGVRPRGRARVEGAGAVPEARAEDARGAGEALPELGQVRMVAARGESERHHRSSGECEITASFGTLFDWLNGGGLICSTSSA